MARQLRSALTVIAVLVGLVWLPSTAGTAAAASLPAASAAANSKTPCAYTSHNISVLTQFSSLVGRDVTCAILFNDTAPNWSAWDSPWFTTSSGDQGWTQWLHSSQGRQLVITQSMVPPSVPANWRARGAAGQYDSEIRQWANKLVSAGLGSTIIRLGHEANGNWYFDSVGSTTADHKSWAAYWARFVQVSRSVAGAHFVFDWTVNAAMQPIPFSEYYPGDGVVDVIGVDQYDNLAKIPYPAPTTAAGRWAAIANQPWGLNAVIAFAKSHGKPLSIPEWGLTTSGSANGTGAGDDAYFINQMASIINNNPVRYQGFWDKAIPGVTLALPGNPNAIAAYRVHFGANGDSLGALHGPVGSAHR